MNIETSMRQLLQLEFGTRSIPRRQSGSALIMSMLLLSAMTLIGVVSMQNTMLEEKMTGNTRDRQLAFEAAEAAIRAGEKYVMDNLFDYTDYKDTCADGLCTRREDDVAFDNTLAPGDAGWIAQRWELNGSLNVWADGSSLYREYPVSFAETSKRPRYIIEFAGYVPTDPSATTSTTPPEWYESPQVAGSIGWQAEWSELYRITALGFGGTPDARVMIQTLYAKSIN